MTSPPEFQPRLALLPTPQQRVFRELVAVPRRFVLYGGTAITLRLGHRVSLDFDFFSNGPFQPDTLEREIEVLRGSVRARSEPNTLVSVVDRGGPVTVSFFGGLPLRRVGDPSAVGSSRVDLQACKLEYSIVSPK